MRIVARLLLPLALVTVLTTATGACLVSAPLVGKECDEAHACLEGYGCYAGRCLTAAPFVDAGSSDGPEDAGNDGGQVGDGDAGVQAADAGEDDGDAGVVEEIDAGPLPLELGAPCTAPTECGSDVCECADADCATRVCAASSCTSCTFTTTGTACDGNRSAATPCDDGSICTAASTCSAGVCPAAPATTCTVVHSRNDFSDVQGENGLTYGYFVSVMGTPVEYDPGVDFLPLEWHPSIGIFRVPGSSDDESASSFRWTSVNSDNMHPDARDARQIPIRRYTSDAAGPARVTIDGEKSNTECGDGTRLLLFVDGVLAWEHTLAFDDGFGVNADVVDVELAVGSTVDLALDPLEEDACDGTENGFVITSR